MSEVLGDIKASLMAEVMGLAHTGLVQIRKAEATPGTTPVS